MHIAAIKRVEYLPNIPFCRVEFRFRQHHKAVILTKSKTEKSTTSGGATKTGGGMIASEAGATTSEAGATGREAASRKRPGGIALHGGLAHARVLLYLSFASAASAFDDIRLTIRRLRSEASGSKRKQAEAKWEATPTSPRFSERQPRFAPATDKNGGRPPPLGAEASGSKK